MTQNGSDREVHEDSLGSSRDDSLRLRDAWQDGRQKGREEGRLVERILMCQAMLKLPVTPEVELYASPIEELKALADQLKSQFRVLSESDSLWIRTIMSSTESEYWLNWGRWRA